MGSLISLIIEVNVEDTMIALDNIPFVILETFNFSDTFIIYTQPEYMGYGEPVELYRKLIKKGVRVHDIHYIDIRCVTNNHIGRNAVLGAWSCKMEDKENGKFD